TECINTEGNYICKCLAGYLPNTWNPRECVNIDEQVYPERGTCGCEQGCIDTPGSYKCTCKPGYILMADGKGCLDVNECRAGVDNACSPLAQCNNLDGSYECVCRDGYYGNGFICSGK
ncbi:unnamed protein product, partial [Owenia fusiformis]